MGNAPAHSTLRYKKISNYPESVNPGAIKALNAR